MSTGSFNYQTTTSTLLGSIDELRIRSEGNMYNWYPTVNGVDTESLNPGYFQGLGGIENVFAPFLAEITEANRRNLDTRNRTDVSNERQKSRIKAITAVRDPGTSFAFRRRPGSRLLSVVIGADWVRELTVESLIPFVDPEVTDYNNSGILEIPFEIAYQIRTHLPGNFTKEEFDFVQARGAAMTDQEIELEIARMRRQEKLSEEANNAAPTQITPESRAAARQSSLETGAKRAQALVPYEAAAERNKASSIKYKWGVDLSVYGGGPGDPALARDAATFQKQRKLEADGIIGKNTLNAVREIRVRAMAEGAKAVIPVEIIKFVNALKIDGLADARTSGGVTQEKFEELKAQGVVKEQAKPSEIVRDYTVKTGLVLPDLPKPAETPAPVATPTTTQAKPRPRIPAKTPVTTSKDSSLTAEQLQNAVKANLVSAATLGWTTSPGVYPEGPRSIQLVRDIAYVQKKYNIRGALGVMNQAVLQRIQNQQLNGLGTVAVDSANNLEVVTRLLNGVITEGRSVPTARSAPPRESDINWYYVAAGVAALVGAVGLVAVKKKKKNTPKLLPRD